MMISKNQPPPTFNKFRGRGSRSSTLPFFSLSNRKNQSFLSLEKPGNCLPFLFNFFLDSSIPRVKKDGTKSTRSKKKKVVIDCDLEDGPSLKPSNILDCKSARPTNWGKQDATQLGTECGFPTATGVYLPLHGECAVQVGMFL